MRKRFKEQDGEFLLKDVSERIVKSACELTFSQIFVCVSSSLVR
jgi:hypothetical protein